jgi:hypothetical protein
MTKEFGSPMSATNAGTTTSTATVSGIATKTHYITDIAGSSDKAGALIQVKDGSTIIWEAQLGATAAGNISFHQSFQTPLKATVGNDVSVYISDGTSLSYSNIAGFTI